MFCLPPKVIFRRSDGSLLEKRMCRSRLRMIFGILIKKSALPSLQVYRDVESKRKYIQTYTEMFTGKVGECLKRLTYLAHSPKNQQYATRDRQYPTKIRDIPINGVGMRTTQDPDAIYGDVA